MFRRPWLGALTLAGLVGIVGCSKSGQPPDDATALPQGDAPVVQLLKEPMDVPAFTVNDLDGKSVSSADLKGKVVLVNFWATWCPPCRAEIPDLIKLQEKYRDKLVVLGISEDEVSPDEVKAFATAQKMNYPVIMNTPELRKIFKGVSALPTTFVIGPEGDVQMRHVGMLNPATTELEAKYLTGELTNARIERVEDETKALITKAAQATEIPGIDLTKLTPQQRTQALKILNQENCTCGCELTLAACRINDSSCGVSLPIAQKIVEQLARGEQPTAAPTH
jgi:cytochrome c biogenesis protein CcmG/thiol:disulfide interchange protein DsbE